MTHGDSMGRHVLPIPDHPHRGLVTYDAKDPDTSFPPIEPLRPLTAEERVRVAMGAPMTGALRILKLSPDPGDASGGRGASHVTKRPAAGQIGERR